MTSTPPEPNGPTEAQQYEHPGEQPQEQQPPAYRYPPSPPGYPPPGYPAQGWPTGYPAPPPRKRHRIFLWMFLAIQALFIVWLIVGGLNAANTASTGLPHEIAQQCAHGAWHGLYNSYADCARQVRSLHNAANGIGNTIGAGLVVGIWVAVDFILGLSYLIYRMATRDRTPPMYCPPAQYPR